MAPLATTSDLSDRGLSPVPDNADLALAVATSLIRDAAGCDISEETSTVTVTGTRTNILGLPGPITTVSAVSIGGTAVTDYEVLPNGLWRRCGWVTGRYDVGSVTVTYTHGLASVPEDIIDLCCNLAKSWLDHAAGGGGSTAGVASWGVDDAREAFTDEAAGQVSPVFIPDATRQWLARRFGGGAAVVELL